MRRNASKVIPSGRDIYGRLRTDDYRMLLDALRETRASRMDIEREATRSGSKLSALLEQHGAYWWVFYELPLKLLGAAVFVLFGWKDEFKRIAATENPGRAMIDFVNAHPDPASEGHIKTFEPAHQALLFNVLLALTYSMEAVGYFSLSINELLATVSEKARSDFFKAVMVDRTVVATRKGQQLISHAQLCRDKGFHKSLFKKMRDPHSALRTYADLRAMRRVMDEASVIASCTDEEITDLVCKHLGLYRSQAGNEVKSLAELLRTWAVDSAR